MTMEQQQAWKKRDANNGYVSLPLTKKSNQFATTDINSKKSYVCNQCGLSFNRADNRKSHLETHSTARPFQCTTCNQFFRRQHDLKRHQKLHTGERPYPCQNCGRSFARLDALNRHQRAEVVNNAVRKTDSLDIVVKTRPQFDSSPPEPTHLLTTYSTTGFKGMSFLPPLKNHDLSPPHSYQSCTYPGKVITSSPNNRITLPSPDQLLLPLLEQANCLAQENRYLKFEIKQLTMDSARMHDLEKENKLLKSLIHQQKR